jgi:hypothetical protein
MTRADAGEVLTRVLGLTAEQAGRLLWSAAHGTLAMLLSGQCRFDPELVRDYDTKRYNLRYF